MIWALINLLAANHEYPLSRIFLAMHFIILDTRKLANNRKDVMNKCARERFYLFSENVT